MASVDLRTMFSAIALAAGCAHYAPTVQTPTTFSVIHDSMYVHTLPASDSNNDPLQYIVLSSVQHGLLVVQNGSFTYIPNSQYIGSDSFQFQVSDGIATSPVATVNLSVCAPSERLL